MIRLETIESIHVHDRRRSENLLANGLVIAEREIGRAVWLGVSEEDDDPCSHALAV